MTRLGTESRFSQGDRIHAWQTRRHHGGSTTYLPYEMSCLSMRLAGPSQITISVQVRLLDRVTALRLTAMGP